MHALEPGERDKLLADAARPAAAVVGVEADGEQAVADPSCATLNALYVRAGVEALGQAGLIVTFAAIPGMFVELLIEREDFDAADRALKASGMRG